MSHVESGRTTAAESLSDCVEHPLQFPFKYMKPLASELGLWQQKCALPHPVSKMIRSLPFKTFKKKRALAGVAQWIECQTANQRVTSSIPSQGTCLGCGPGPQ